MKRITAFILLMVTGYFYFNFKAVTHASSPNTSKTGAPGENSCTQCHPGSANTGSGSIIFNFPDNKWQPDSNYLFTLEVSDSIKSRFGFQMTAINNSGNGAGNFSLINTANTTLKTSNGKQYVGHKNADGTNLWTFNWTAPNATNIDTTVTFYIAGNATNNNGSTLGDNVYTTNISVNQIEVPDTFNNDTSSIISSINDIHVNLFPNPSTNYIHLSSSSNIITKASIYTSNGSFVTSVIFLGKDPMRTINIENLNNGKYIIKLYSNYSSFGTTTFVKN